MIDKFSALNNTVILYNACKGILRLKQADFSAQFPYEALQAPANALGNARKDAILTAMMGRTGKDLIGKKQTFPRTIDLLPENTTRQFANKAKYLEKIMKRMSTK